MDFRLLWFVKCINNVFEIGTESETVKLFGETLNKDEGFLRQKFIQYLESSTINRNVNTNIFYIYTTTVKKVIKEEIEVEEERKYLNFEQNIKVIKSNRKTGFFRDDIIPTKCYSNVSRFAFKRIYKLLTHL